MFFIKALHEFFYYEIRKHNPFYNHGLPHITLTALKEDKLEHKQVGKTERFSFAKNSNTYYMCQCIC